VPDAPSADKRVAARTEKSRRVRRLKFIERPPLFSARTIRECDGNMDAKYVQDNILIRGENCAGA